MVQQACLLSLVSHIVRVSSGNVHLPQSVVREDIAGSSKLGGLVVVLEGLVVVTLCVCGVWVCGGAWGVCVCRWVGAWVCVGGWVCGCV